MITSNNLVVNGGTFNQTIARTQLDISFDKLAVKASPLAFHLADSDRSHSTCFVDTRTKILERLQSWALRKTERDTFVMWLNGAAGGGKTAIGRTIAKWCEDEGILLGEFFFSRADGTGSQLTSLAPTLAYRMAVHTLQDAKKTISDVVCYDPHIFLAPLAVQLKKLVLAPLNLLAPCGITPYVVILDGLDETLEPNDQQLVLDAISETLYPFDSSLRILICSRPEATIVSAFNDPDSSLHSISTTISLSDDPDSDADIRAFLVDKFAGIKKQLPYLPNEDWPTPANIDYLVAKSSGQFIFAATVEKYVCSPKHRHQAVARLKHVLDLRLLPHFEDKKKHPFADLDALYALILKTRNDVDMSVKTTAICLEYPKYFTTISPLDLAKVLDIEPSETWGILYELASLFDVSEKSIRPFHASFGDFLCDHSRSLELYYFPGDIVTDITCAMLRPRRNPRVLSYHTFSRLLGEATPHQDLRDVLSEMTPVSIFGRPSSIKCFGVRFSDPYKGAYHLIPLLRRLERHVSSDVHKNLVTYFDEQFSLFLPSGCWTSSNFLEDRSCRNKYPDLTDDSDESDFEDSDSDGSEDSGEERIRRGQALEARGPELASYKASELTPLSTSPVWDEINAQLNIHLSGPDSLQSLCDEAHFVRSHLPKTSSALLNDLTQANAALFCLEQINDVDITEDLRIAFAKLLPHALSHAKRLPQLMTDIQALLTQQPTICERLPLVTVKAMTSYLGRLPSSGQSRKPIRSAMKSRSSQSPSTTEPKFRTPTLPPASRTQISTNTRPSTSAIQKPLTASRTRDQPKVCQLATDPDSESSTTKGPSTSGATLEPLHPSQSLASAWVPSNGSHQRQGHHKRGSKGRWK